MKPDPSIRNTWRGAAAGAAGAGSPDFAGPGSTTGFSMTAALISFTLPFPLRPWRRRIARRRSGIRRPLPATGQHRSVDETPRTIGAFGLSRRGKVQIDLGMTERPAAAVAG